MNLVTRAGSKIYFLTAFVSGIATLLVESSSAHTFMDKVGHPSSTSTRKLWGRLPTTTACISSKSNQLSADPHDQESTLWTLRGGDNDANNNQQPPPASPPLIKFFQRSKAEALVADGAALLESKGTHAFQEMSKAGSKWFRGSTYLFVYDLKCNVLFNAASPEKVGKNTKGHPDKNGKLFHDALVAQADMPDKCGWVDYMWPKPGQDKPSQKWTYSKAVTIDGKRAVLMSGFY